ncbi:MAG: autotransporter assembly complex protein TamA [Chromatiales bacterium]|nr:autotransporter assembly complex protein TamA [Chromatiales bacterium]
MTKPLFPFVMLLVSIALSAPLLAQEAEKLIFEGVEDELLNNVRAALSLAEEPCDAPRWRIRRLFNKSDLELQRAARALGYYHIEIDKSLAFNDTCWQATFKITPGEALNITSTDIRINGEASNDPVFSKLLAESPVQIGAPVHHGHYENLKRDIEIIAAERGYFDGKLTITLLLIDTDKRETEIVIHYNSGERYHIGELRLHQDAYAEKLINKYVTLKPGDLYNSNDLVSLQKTLTNSGYFDNISIRPDLQGLKDGLIDIDIRLIPRKRIAYKVGIGASSDTGPRVVLGYEKRRLNALGHRFESHATLSPQDTQATAEYIIPLTTPDAHQLGFQAGYRHLETDSSTTRTSTLGVNRLGERWGSRETVKLEWIDEEYTLGDETRDGALLIPSIAWSRTEADSQIRTTRGYRLNLELRGAHSTLLSDASFVQGLAQAKWINPLWRGRLILRGEAGATVTNSFNKIPVTYRFFAGGDQSARGYDFEALGPRDSEGDVVGGRYLLTSSIEYEHPINDRWGVALFTDAGNAYDDGNEGLKTGVGAGVRWQSPVGPVRVDLAFPLDDDADDTFRIHFSMGPDL